MATTKQRNEIEEHILADRPDINPWILKNLLDVYCAEGGKDVLQSLVKEDMKLARKGKAPVKPVRASVMDGITVSAWDDTWEARAREIADKAGARVLTEEEAARMRGETISNAIVEEVK
jgi:ribosome recycling factor